MSESEARLKLVTNAAGAGLWVAAPETGRVWVAPKTRELFHFAPDEVLDYESFFQVIHPEDREWVHQTMQQALQSGESLYIEQRIVLPDGSIRWIVSRGQRYLQAGGEPGRMMGVSLDITERRRLEETLKVERKKLAEANATLRILLRQREEDRIKLEESLLTNERAIIEATAARRFLRLFMLYLKYESTRTTVDGRTAREAGYRRSLSNSTFAVQSCPGCRGGVLWQQKDSSAS